VSGIEVAQRETRALRAGLIDPNPRQAVTERIDYGRLDLGIVRDDESTAVVQQRGTRRQTGELRGNQIRLDVAE